MSSNYDTIILDAALHVGKGNLHKKITCLSSLAGELEKLTNGQTFQTD